MKLALLGTGMIVKEVLPVLQTLKGIDLVSILSTPRSIAKAEALTQAYGLSQATSNYQEILNNPDVDTIYIGTPNHTHYDYAKEALLAGKHVICEKPFTMKASELVDLSAIAQKYHLFLLEAITNQYLDNFSIIKSNLEQLGEIKIVECNYSQYSSRYDAFKRGEIAPAFNPEMGGGALRDLNIYNLHLLVGLFGKPKTVHYLPNIERGVDTSGMLALDFDQFKAVSIGAKDCTADIRTTIQGTKGNISLIGPTNSMPKVLLTLNGQEPQDITQTDPHHRMYQEFLAFEKMIRNRDFVAAHRALKHSQAVMDVLDQAAAFM
ncbi:Gfo/Idh/MocA family protein [Streptococcus dentasini]